uniref:Immunoglobulin domain-containing protein n=1 Tax=Panthera tigris altaica TaxID=74533 RepID=A0A8C9K0K0_PANTA
PWLRRCILGFCLLGCLSIQGPESVRGLEGGSVTVRCDYQPRWDTYRKWWCRGAYWELCRILVQTTGSQLEVKGDRVSIGDNRSHHFLTVTMEKVRQDDTDTYWCGISKSGPDLGAPIRHLGCLGPDRSVPSCRNRYILLVFVKVPILLILVGVVLWLKVCLHELVLDLLTKDTAA